MTISFNLEIDGVCAAKMCWLQIASNFQTQSCSNGMGGYYALYADGSLLWIKSIHAYQQERLHTTVWTSNKIGPFLSIFFRFSQQQHLFFLLSEQEHLQQCQWMCHTAWTRCAPVVPMPGVEGGMIYDCGRYSVPSTNISVCFFIVLTNFCVHFLLLCFLLPLINYFNNRFLVSDSCIVMM